MSVASAQATKPSRKRCPRFNAAILLGVPYVVFMVVFGLVPMILALIFSFSKYGGYQPEYLAAGLSNYVSILTDPQLIVSFGNVFKFAAVMLPVSFVGALGIALILDLARDRLGEVMRTIYFVPGAITLPAVALIMIFMFDPGISPFGFLLRLTGATAVGQIMTNKTLVLFMVILRFFSSSGGWIAVFYGALTGISREVIEAAMIDGCSPWQMAYHIKRPLIMGYVFFMIITLSISSIQIFAEPFIMQTSLGTTSPIDPYWAPNMWSAFITVRTGDFGKSAVISLIMLSISLMAAILIVTRTGQFKTDVVRE